MDINEPKSRCFNIYLRYFQLGLQVLIATKLSQIDASACDSSYQKISQFTSYLILAFNLISMIVMRCLNNFPRIFFFISFIIYCILAAVIGVFAFFGMMEYNTCANNRVLFRFAFIQSAHCIVITIMILFLPFHWIQRYSNTPGNLVWIFLFLGFAWSSEYKIVMYIQGSIFITISVLNFVVNIIACSGITTKIKKAIVFAWIFSLVFMLVGQALAIIVYFQSTKNEFFIDNLALKLFQIFIFVNTVDFIFWLWGYLTLEYENGDKIRDQLMRGKYEESQYSQNVEPYNFNESQPNAVFGTIRR